jgi:hypothetical protein
MYHKIKYFLYAFVACNIGCAPRKLARYWCGAVMLG